MDCLETPVVLRKILQHFSNNELLKLSFVNKQWNYEARSVLRNRATLHASIRSNHLCRRIADFAADLENMRAVPFSGIQLVLSRQPSPPLPNESLDSFYKSILQKLLCRHFSVHFVEEWENYRDTPGLELVTRILKDYSEVLEELSFKFNRQQVEMPQQFVQDQRFLRLKVLKIEVDAPATADKSLPIFLKALVSRTPNLEELQMRGTINFNENILEGSSAVLVPCLAFNPLYERVCKSLVGALRPGFIDLRAHSTVSFDEELLNRHIPRVLQASLPTLHILHMDLIFLVPFMCYGICLENVTVLVIRIDYHEHLRPRTSKLLKHFDFTRTFPKLTQVTITTGCTSSIAPEQISGFVERGNARLKKILPDRAVNIKQLSLHPVSDSTVELLAQMFPDVERIFLFSRSILFTFLKGHFRYLRQVIPTCP